MRSIAPGLLLGLSLVASLGAQETTNPQDWVTNFDWKCIGPANMGGRITALSVYEKNPRIFFASTASGGLLKTVNNGITFEHQFDHETTVSIGDVCISQSNPDIVWVGTGEENPRNSVSYGDGVYKSVDGGKTWKNMGLKKTFQIGAVVVHPTNPDIVYVGALGRLYGDSEERGLYKTTNGGESWRKIHFVDEKTGVIDIQMNPKDHDTLIFATYERQRDGFDGNAPAKKIAPGSGLWRTNDAGETFTKLTNGLPTNNFGRVGIDYFRKDPNTVFAIIESEMMGKPPENVGYSGIGASDGKPGAKVARLAEGSAADKAGVEKDDIVLAVNNSKVSGGVDLIEQICQFEVGEKITLTVKRGEAESKIEVTLEERPARDGGGGRGGRGGFGGRGRGGAGGGETITDGLVNFGGRLGGSGANLQGFQGKHAYEHGGVFRSDDGGSTWKKINSIDPRPMYFSQFRVDPSDTNYQYVLGISGSRSVDGGKTFTSDATRGVHADHHALWIDPNDGNHMILGCDGGIYVTYDRTANWQHLNHNALGQFYHVAIGPRENYWVYGGLQDNGTWGAPHRVGGSGPINEDWIRIGGGDGFVVQVDPNDPDQIYSESQNGATGWRNLRTGESGRISPNQRQRGGAQRGGAQRGGAQRGGGQRGGGQRGGGQRGGGQRGGGAQRRRYRFNWRTPFILSHHNSRIYYNVGNHVFRSLDRGNNIKAISPEITTGNRGSGTAIAESPLDADVLYAGTDDGGLWMTKNGDHNWVNLRKPFSDGDGEDGDNEGSEGVPFTEIVKKPMWISGIEASRYSAGRVYVTVDGHRSDDDDPYVLLSEDFGRTWTSLRNNLPRGSTRVVREDRVNEDLLYVGTEFGLYVSLNRGKEWVRFHNNLPTVAIHEVAQHATLGDIVVATHGRSLWVVDVTPLRTLTQKALQQDVFLCKPADVLTYGRGSGRGSSGGASRFVGEVKPGGTHIYFNLKSVPEGLKLQIKDVSGKVIYDVPTPKLVAGLNHVVWSGQRNPTGRGGQGAQGRFGGRGGRGRGGRGRFGRGGGGTPGTYKVVLTVGESSKEADFEIRLAKK